MNLYADFILNKSVERQVTNMDYNFNNIKFLFNNHWLLGLHFFMQFVIIMIIFLEVHVHLLCSSVAVKFLLFTACACDQLETFFPC